MYRPPFPQEKRREEEGGGCTQATDLAPSINFNSAVLDQMKFRHDFKGKMLKLIYEIQGFNQITLRNSAREDFSYNVGAL